MPEPEPTVEICRTGDSLAAVVEVDLSDPRTLGEAPPRITLRNGR